MSAALSSELWLQSHRNAALNLGGSLSIELSWKDPPPATAFCTNHTISGLLIVAVFTPGYHEMHSAVAGLHQNCCARNEQHFLEFSCFCRWLLKIKSKEALPAVFTTEMKEC